MSFNPYPTLPGFGFRVGIAERKLRSYALTFESEQLYTRGFDNCFEMGDGSAVVYALMRKCHEGDEILERGIKMTGVWMDWLATYRRHSERQFDFRLAPAQT